MPLVLNFSGLIDEKRLNNCINQLISRHESLRTIFIEEEGIPYQKVLSKGNIPLQIKHFKGNNSQGIIQEELQKTF